MNVALATEDVLSEAVGTSLLTHPSCALTPALFLRKDGQGYLKSRIKSWIDMAQYGQAVVLLTDLDRVSCPVRLVQRWLNGAKQPQNFVLRVAVRSVESWLLADQVAMQRLLGPRAKLPLDPDRLPDPKRHLLMLARNATRDVREELTAERGAIAAQGPGYNFRLCTFVQETWDPLRASQRSASLRRAMQSLQQLAARLRSEA